MKAPRPPSVSSWAAVRHVLAVRLDAMGDLLMTGPALRALKRSAPDRRVTLLTSPAGAAAATLLPDVDAIMTYQAPWMKASARPSPADDLAMIRRLAQLRPDAAAIFTVYSQNSLPAAMLCHLAGIPRRLAHCRETPYHLLTDWIPETEPERGTRHETRRQLDLVAAVGCRVSDERLAVRVPASAPPRIAQRLRGAGLADRRWVVVHPGACAPSRRYPVEAFADVVRLLHGCGIRAVITGDATEAPLAAELIALAGVTALNLAGQLSLAELAALLAAAPLLIANNTGPVHLAAAVDTPVVDLYALTNPQHAPWGVPHRLLYQDVPCKFCYRSVCPEGHHACLRGVSPHAVVDAALELLGQSSPYDAEPSDLTALLTGDH